MIFIHILSLLIIFVASSWFSGWMLRRMGYPPPVKFENRDDYILAAMKLLLFMITSLLLLALIMLAGVDPLNLMG